MYYLVISERTLICPLVCLLFHFFIFLTGNLVLNYDKEKHTYMPKRIAWCTESLVYLHIIYILVYIKNKFVFYVYYIILYYIYIIDFHIYINEIIVTKYSNLEISSATENTKRMSRTWQHWAESWQFMLWDRDTYIKLYVTGKNHTASLQHYAILIIFKIHTQMSLSSVASEINMVQADVIWT